MVELAYTGDLKPPEETHMGSSPITGTQLKLEPHKEGRVRMVSDDHRELIDLAQRRLNADFAVIRQYMDSEDQQDILRAHTASVDISVGGEHVSVILSFYLEPLTMMAALGDGEQRAKQLTADLMEIDPETMNEWKRLGGGE